MRTKLWSRCCELKNTVIDGMNIYAKMMSHPKQDNIGGVQFSCCCQWNDFNHLALSLFD